ncbi:Mep-1 [Aphelenchoides bicaudatus]|nr:Mep-1 [Aphelenchoides bicaudatus]
MYPNLNNSAAIPDYIGYADLTENNEREQLMDSRSLANGSYDQRKVTRALKGRKLNLLRSPDIKRQPKMRKSKWNLTIDRRSGSNSDEFGELNEETEVMEEMPNEMSSPRESLADGNLISGMPVLDRKRKHSSPATIDINYGADIEQTGEQASEGSEPNDFFEQMLFHLQQSDYDGLLECVKSRFTNSDNNLNTVFEFVMHVIHKFNKSLEAIETTKTAALDQVELLHQFCDLRSQLVDDQEQEIIELKQRLSLADNRIILLTEKCLADSNQNEKLKTKNARLLFEVNQRSAAVKQKIVEECAICPGFASANEQLQVALNKADEQIEQLNKIVADNSQEIASLKLKNSHMECDLIVNRAQIKEQDKRAEDAAELIIELEGCNAALLEEIDEMEKCDKQLSNNTSSAESQTSTSNLTASNLTPVQKIYCEICNQSFGEKLNYLKHLRDDHFQHICVDLDAQQSVTCPACQKQFWTYSGLELHLLADHDLVTEDFAEKIENETDEGWCKTCDEFYSTAFVHHLTTEHEVTLKTARIMFNCKECSFTSHSYAKFFEHIQESHPTDGMLSVD